jgi:putative membrane protein
MTLACSSAWFHPSGHSLGWDWLSRWSGDPLALFGIALCCGVYAAGVWRLWQRAGIGHGVRRWQAACFALSLGATAIALLSPVDTLSDHLFSVHMVQHELLLLVSAPLWAMSAPLVAMSWALPRPGRRFLQTNLHRPGAVRAWRVVGNPTFAVLLHAAVLWVWHAPSLFEAALRSEAVHAVQHLSFFATAVLFWWTIVYGRYGRIGYGVGVAFVFATATHGGVLGALFTLADRVVYQRYEQPTRSLGVNPVADQQLAGLLMWVPAGIILTCLGLALFAAWLGEARRRVRGWQTANGLGFLEDP